MPTVAHLYQRLTHRYRAGFADLGESRYLGTAKVLKPSVRSMGNHHDVGPTYRIKAIVGREVPLHHAERALHAYFSEAYTARCTHDHDCCGCRFAYVRVARTGGREFAVVVNTMRNY